MEVCDPCLKIAGVLKLCPANPLNQGPVSNWWTGYPSAVKSCNSIIAAVGLAVATAMAQDALEPEGPERIATTEAQAHDRETCVVTAKVVQVTIREKLVYLNLDKKSPECRWSA